MWDGCEWCDGTWAETEEGASSSTSRDKADWGPLWRDAENEDPSDEDDGDCKRGPREKSSWGNHWRDAVEECPLDVDGDPFVVELNPPWREAGGEVGSHEEWRRPPEDWLTEKYAVRDELVKVVCEKLEFHPTVDAFSEVRTARFPKWWGPGSPYGTDAFKMAWRHERLWVNPPFSRYNEVMDKVIADKAHILAVMPVWADRAWYKRAMAMMECSWVVPAGSPVFYMPGQAVGPTRWPVMFATLRGDWGSKPVKVPVEPPRYQSAEKITKSAKRTLRRWKLATANAQQEF